MRQFFVFLSVLLLSAPALASAQAAPADTLRPVSPTRQLSYTYANDLYFRTDYYFTQGMTLTLVLPALARLPTQRLLARGPVGSTQYHGVALRYDGFTPLRIQDDFIRVGDRPYASYIYSSFFRVSRAPQDRQRLTTALEIGFIGPAAGAKEFQTAIHRVTNSPTPRGWDYQIQSDPVLGYRVAYERQLLAAPGIAELRGTTEASLSTLYTYGSAGAQLRVGRLSPGGWAFGIGDGGSQQPLYIMGLATLEGRLIGYDATLQGGIFNRNNPYTLAAADIRRTVLRRGAGMTIAYRAVQLAGTATWVSPEFAGGRSHAWSQFRLTVRF